MESVSGSVGGDDLHNERQRIEDEITKACERHFRVFVREAWRYIDPKPFVPGWHIDGLADITQACILGYLDNLVANEPPRHTKSTVISVMLLPWIWGPLNRPWLRAVFLSYGTAPALRDAVRSRRLMQSAWYQQRWGDRFRFSSDQNVKGRYENDHGGQRFSSSFESGVTGEGGDLIVVDDPIQIDDADNIEKIKHVNAIWDGTIVNRADSANVKKIILAHRVNEDDLSGHVLGQSKDLHEQWTHVCFPAEFERVRRTRVMVNGRVLFEDPRVNEGEWLHPQRWPQHFMEDLKTVTGSYRWAGLYQQRPAPASGGIFQRTWWRYWKILPVEFDDRLISLDATFGAKHDQASFVCIQAWARLGAFKYLIDQVRARMTFPETLRAFEQFCARYPAFRLKLVEAKANGPAVIQTLRDRIPGILPIEVREDKPARARAVSPDVESGCVYLPHESVRPWVGEFVEECATFPKATFNDQVDCMTQALKRWIRNADDLPVAAIRAR